MVKFQALCCLNLVFKALPSFRRVTNPLVHQRKVGVYKRRGKLARHNKKKNSRPLNNSLLHNRFQWKERCVTTLKRPCRP